MQNVCEKLYVDISLIMHDTHLQLYIGIKNIAVEGTVSQNCDESPSLSFIKSRSKYSKKVYKKLHVI